MYFKFNTRISYGFAAFTAFVFLSVPVCSVEVKPGQDSECYTANGKDYNGNQNTTYVRGDAPYEPTEPGVEDCLAWTNPDLPKNFTHLPKNYCRNPNNKLFPWCYVMRDGSPTFAYCHIPTCYTPAFMNCYRATIKGTDDLLLDGQTLTDDSMKIARCLNYCRSRKYDYAGLTNGNTCMCGSRDKNQKQLDDVLNILHPHDCMNYSCVGDKMQACGSDGAIAVYDVEAGACHGTYHDRPSGIIYSPRWPGNYDNDLTCYWTIYIPKDYTETEGIRQRHSLRLSFPYFKTENTTDKLKIYSYANDSDTNPTLITTISGSVQQPNITFLVDEIHAVHIVFVSDPKGKHDGFIIRYEVYESMKPNTTTLPDIVITDAPESPPPSTRRTTTQPTPAPTEKTEATPKKTVTTTLTTTTSNNNAVKSTVSTISTVTTNTSSKAVKADATSSSKGGMIAGIVLGVIVFILLVVLGAFAFIKYRSNLAAKEESRTAPPMFDNPVRFDTDTTL